MDFAPATGGFRPASCAPVVARTTRVVAEAKSLDGQFVTSAWQYFSTARGDEKTGVTTLAVIAAATRAGFAGADTLIERAVSAGILMRPKPYKVWITQFAR